MAVASRILISGPVYALAALLCVRLTSETLLVSYSYRGQQGPPSSKLLPEALKLLIASMLFLGEVSLDDKHSGASGHSLSPLPGCQEKTQGRGYWSACTAWMKAMLVFAVPAIIYFVNNNLVFYALRIMSVHAYTLMCDLKVITTGVLSYLVLDRHLNCQAAVSLALLFAGISLGQLATVTAGGSTAGSTVATGARDAAQAASWLYGVLLMTLVAILSALASVYTEWVM